MIMIHCSDVVLYVDLIFCAGDDAMIHNSKYYTSVYEHTQTKKKTKPPSGLHLIQTAFTAYKIRDRSLKKFKLAGCWGRARLRDGKQ